jgi:flagellar hook-associated protein 2
VTNAIPGVSLQLQAAGTSTVTVTSDNTSSAQTLLNNIGQAYNDLMSSFTALTKYDADPTKRGSLYGDASLQSMMDSISLSFTSSLTRSGTVIKDTKNNPISLTSLGLEIQLDGTMKFNSSVYDAAVSAGAFDQVAQGTTSPTRTYVDSAMLYGGAMDSDIASFTDQNTYLQSQVKDLQTRKDEKMAKYRAQYAALDALLFQLQSTNNSLSATFNALNNQKSN